MDAPGEPRPPRGADQPRCEMTLSPRFAETRGSLHALGEHVPAATRYHAIGRIGLQVAPGGGDAKISEPYLYVGPTGLDLAATGDSFWNQPFGAAATREDIGSVEDAVAFFRQGRQHAAGRQTGPPAAVAPGAP